MMKLRKWSSLNKAEKLGRKNALKHLLYFQSIPIALFILTIIIRVFRFETDIISAIVSFFVPPNFLILFIESIIFSYYFLTKSLYIDAAHEKLLKDFSKKLAEKMLVRGKPTKVKLLKTRDGYYSDFILKDLNGKVDYYAVLEVNHNIIVIYPKFFDEKEEDFFDDISNERRNRFDFIEMEEFSSFCEIVDN